MTAVDALGRHAVEEEVDRRQVGDEDERLLAARAPRADAEREGRAVEATALRVEHLVRA